MTLSAVWLFLAPIVLLGYTAEVMTGFGASLIVVTLGAQFMPVERLVPVVVALNLITALYIVVRYWHHVQKTLVVRQILPSMGLGIALGLLLSPHISGEGLRRVLGLFVAVFATRMLILLERSGEEKPLQRWQGILLQIVAGVAHAFFSTGGPPLVASLVGRPMTRQTFRATLSLVWCVLSTVLFITFVANGRLSRANLELSFSLMPVLPLGVWLGERLHHRLPEKPFRRSLGLLLLLGGLSLLIR